MDFEAFIPVQISPVQRRRTRAGSKLKLNNTTGSLELERIISELDEKQSVKSLDTSLDSGLQKVATKKRRKAKASRLLTELESDLGPRFNMSSDGGNLRSKYGRLQKVNEGIGYVPSDVLRMRNHSPVKCPIKSPSRAIKAETTKEEVTMDQQVVEEEKIVEVNSDATTTEIDKTLSNASDLVMIVVSSEETMDVDLMADPEESVAIVVVKEEHVKLPQMDTEEAVDCPVVKEEHITLPQMNTEEPVDCPVNDLPLEVVLKSEVEEIADPPSVTEETVPLFIMPQPRSPAASPVVPKEEEKPLELRPPPPPAPSQAGRRLSMRRLSVWATKSPTTTTSPSTPQQQVPVVAAMQVKQEPVTSEWAPLEVVRTGIFMSPDCVEYEKFIALQHLTPGALIWGCLGKYPPWPCMVCVDEKGIFMKQNAGRLLRFMVYVRFFGPKGLNSWISPNNHVVFDPNDISEDLRYGTLFSKRPCVDKIQLELNWAIEDAQVVATESDLGKRADVFAGIINEQFNRWKEDKKQAEALNPSSIKRRRSSVASNNSENISRRSLDANSKKRIKLSTPVMDTDMSTHSSFSSALSTTSSSGVSTMGKGSDTLSVSSAGLGETDEEMPKVDEEDDELELNAKQTKAQKRSKAQAEKQKKMPEETLDEKLSTILKAIPVDIGEMKKEKREELCRNCTRGAAAGTLRHCSGSCGGFYHDQCLDSMEVSFERFTQGQQKLKHRSNKKSKKKSRSSFAALAEDEGVELDDSGDIATIYPHITGETDLSNLPPIPQMPQLLQQHQKQLKPQKKPAKEKSEAGKLYKCKACTTGEYPACFICHKATTEEDKTSEDMTLCSMANCGRAFHLQCLDKWPQSKKRKESFICPAHQCHLCISDDPRSQNFKQKSKQKLYKCIYCPTAYHLEQNCMPAGTEIVGNLAIICQRHFPLAEVERERKVKPKMEAEEENNNNTSVMDTTATPIEGNDSVVAVATEVLKKPPKSSKKKNLPAQLNVNWCFICARGGSLVCCDQCPSAFHSECLSMNEEETKRRTVDEETFICEECEAGRFPLYGELVWAKFGSYRWWPAVIMSEGQVPFNLNPSRRSRGEFCIKFLGSNDHAWIGRKRVFLYTDDDAQLAVDKTKEAVMVTPPQKGKKGAKSKAKENEMEKSPLKELTQWNGGGGAGGHKKGMEGVFRLSMLEARVMNGMLQERKQMRQQELSKLMRPPPFQKLKTNRPVAPVKLVELRADAQEDLICNCVAIDEPGREEKMACGPSSECLNRLLLTECNPAYCQAGERCDNQRLQRRQYPELDAVKTQGKGWGLVAKQDLKEGELVVEYVGELINNQEMRERIEAKEQAKDDVYYFLTLTKDLIIDAERKGNMARFMNHSCDPNCESQKWTVNGNTRVGIFARQTIKAGTELTFNYHWESTGTTSTACQCGAKKCKGFIGGDPKKS